MKSYLSPRQVQVKHNSETLNCYQIQMGVTQRSIFGPLQWFFYTADTPSIPHNTIATFANDTVLLPNHKNPFLALEQIQHHLNLLQMFLNRRCIMSNQSRLMSQLQHSPSPAPVPTKTENMHWGLHLDQRLTWQGHVKRKRQQLNLKLRRMCWLLGRKSPLSLQNKSLLYKIITKPLWTQVIQLWGYAKPSNIQTSAPQTCFARGPLLASKRNHGSSHPSSRKYSVRMIGIQNLKKCVSQNRL
jgi:hypothetical protein